MKKAAFLHSVVVTPLICGAALLLASAPAAAGMQWKWKDASGAIQYSDRPPPPGVSDKDILSRPPAARAAAKAAAAEATTAASAAASAPAVKTVDPELEAKRKKADEEKKAQQKAEEEKAAKNRADNCQRARSYQRTLNDGIRISRTNANGEREILDDKGRAEEMRQVEETIRNNCK
ncbi:MAG: DUF4124 domain-containing protein [Aquabacterium sp.]